MDKKELILTTAKELMVAYKFPVNNSSVVKTPQELINIFGGLFADLVKYVEKAYDSINRE